MQMKLQSIIFFSHNAQPKCGIQFHAASEFERSLDKFLEEEPLTFFNKTLQRTPVTQKFHSSEGLH